MIDWAKLQPMYERKAYRIVQKHIKSILNGIPYKNASLQTYEYLIAANITEKQVKEMFIELYTVIGLNYGNRINRDLEKIKKANVLFNEYLLNEILVFLSRPTSEIKITSVHKTLIEDVINAIKETLGPNATIIDVQNAIYNIVSKSTTFYKWQSLRIARTETTSASGFAAIKTAEQSDLVLTKTWIAAIDNRTRNDHKTVNGDTVDLYSNFIMASGVEMQYPGDLGSKENPVPANEVINCRCTIAFTPKRDINGDLITKK